MAFYLLNKIKLNLSRPCLHCIYLNIRYRNYEKCSGYINRDHFLDQSITKKSFFQKEKFSRVVDPNLNVKGLRFQQKKIN